MSVPGYKGDLEFMKLLKSVGSKKELPEVRAIIMRSIWSLDFIPPSDIIAKVMPESGADKATTEAFIGQLLAHYNQLSDHQEPGNSFRLFTFPKVDTYGWLMKKIGHRQLEMKELTPLFHEKDRFKSKEQKDKVFDLLDRFGVCLKDIGILLDSVMGKFEDATHLPAADQEMTRIEQNIESIFNELGQLYSKERKARMFLSDVLGDVIGSEGYDDIPGDKIGRNDPCPCGSGKKFKKCCLN